MSFSDYIVFVDESGDHNLEIINPEYPAFVLAFCVFRKEDYINFVCPRVQEFKLRWFGHDNVVLHEREIRKDMPPFDFLKSKEMKSIFQGELSQIIADAPMTIIPTVIRKDLHRKRYHAPDNPYHLALLFCLERLSSFLSYNRSVEGVTHIIFEQRGGKKGGGDEDKTLELEFRRIMDGQHYLAKNGFKDFDIQIVPKATNSIGLQLADLVARPIGLKCLRPGQENRAHDVIRTKYMQGNQYPYEHTGIKRFP